MTAGKKVLNAILGLNLSSVIRGLRFGFRELGRACIRGHETARPWELRALQSLPTVTLEEILGGRKPRIRISLRPHEDGILNLEHALPLLAIMVAEAPKTVLEIGTFMGHTTKAMADNLPDGIVHTVDLPPEFRSSSEDSGPIVKSDFHLIARRDVGREFRDTPEESRIRQHFADTATWDFSEAGKPEFFFIDGSHTYDYCKNDSEKCLALCTGGEVFFWHDCDEVHPDVARFLSEWREMGRNVVRVANTHLAYWKND